MALTALDQITEKAQALGFDHVAVTRPQIPEQDKKDFEAWCLAGHAGEMQYMTRNPKERFEIEQTYPGIKSVLTLGVSYYQGPLPEKPGPGYGRVARYAWGLDYHTVILERLKTFLAELDVKATIAIDTKPLLERALAKQAGLGFVGKNTVLIIPKFHVGSFVFLTELLLDIPCDVEESREELKGCGDCTKCLTACPTDAFEKPYSLNANKCISYLTIENKGWIDKKMRLQVGDWVFGCDVCQDVCPFNARAKETQWPEFKADNGVGAWVSLKEILEVPDQKTFKAKWGNTPFSRSKRKGMIRNACVVAGNSGDESLISPLKNLLEDEEPLIRGHALWALKNLTSSSTYKTIADKHRTIERDENVRQEI